MMTIVVNCTSSSCRRSLSRTVPYEVKLSIRTGFRRSRSCICQCIHSNNYWNTNQQQHIQIQNSNSEQPRFKTKQQQLRQKYYLHVGSQLDHPIKNTTSLYRKNNNNKMISLSLSSSSSSSNTLTTTPPDGNVDTQQAKDLNMESSSIITNSSTTPEITSLITTTENGIENIEKKNNEYDKNDIDDEEILGKQTTETLEKIHDTYEIVQNMVKETTYEYHRRISKRNQIKQYRQQLRRRYNERRHPSHPLYVKSMSKVLADRRTVLDILFPNPYRYDIDPNKTTIRQEIIRFFNHILYDKEYQTRVLNIWTLYKATWIGFRKPGFFPESEEDRIKNEQEEKDEEIRKQKEEEEEEQEEANNTSKNKKSKSKQQQVVTGFTIGGKTFTSLSDIKNNIQSNVQQMINEKENIQNVVHTNTGIKNMEDIKVLAQEYMSLATNCINEFISGYKVGRDTEMNKMIINNNEYFSSATTPQPTTTTEPQKETKQKKRPTTTIATATVTTGDNDDAIVETDILSSSSSSTTTIITPPITEQVQRKKRKVKKRIINPYSY